ncbi:MAG: GTPase Era [Candidatus Omnitrophica bacterium]|nr:GTPase Era [Candidatus Omnitrophota bacterium]
MPDKSRNKENKEIKKEQTRCGFVSVVGRPNVGKSTLVNKMIGEKISIVSRVPQTTRRQIRGIYTDERGQIIFIDTPGLHLGSDRLDRFMNRSSTGTLDEVDCVIHLVDPSRRVGEEEKNVVQHLKSIKVPIILGLNKVDLKSLDFTPYISLWEKMAGKAITDIKHLTMIAISGKSGINLDKLMDIIFHSLPRGPLLYPQDIICDLPRRLAMADIIREKLFNLMRQEIPHSLEVYIEHVQPRKGNMLNVKALIMVARPGQKEIVIGKKGEILKLIGTKARKELEILLESKVFLDLHVKAKKGWRDNLSVLQDLGYEFFID